MNAVVLQTVRSREPHRSAEPSEDFSAIEKHIRSANLERTVEVANAIATAAAALVRAVRLAARAIRLAQ